MPRSVTMDQVHTIYGNLNSLNNGSHHQQQQQQHLAHAQNQSGLVNNPYVHRVLPTSATLDNMATSVGGHRSNDDSMIAEEEDVMALYSVVNKQQQQRNGTLPHQHSHYLPHPQGSLQRPHQSGEQLTNYEDTESEYAVELRRQAYLQSLGKFSSE